MNAYNHNMNGSLVLELTLIHYRFHSNSSFVHCIVPLALYRNQILCIVTPLLSISVSCNTLFYPSFHSHFVSFQLIFQNAVIFYVLLTKTTNGADLKLLIVFFFSLQKQVRCVFRYTGCMWRSSALCCPLVDACVLSHVSAHRSAVTIDTDNVLKRAYEYKTVMSNCTTVVREN